MIPPVFDTEKPMMIIGYAVDGSMGSWVEGDEKVLSKAVRAAQRTRPHLFLRLANDDDGGSSN